MSFSTRKFIFLAKVKDFLFFGTGLIPKLLLSAIFGAALVFRFFGDRRRAFKLFSKVHRSGAVPQYSKASEEWLRGLSTTEQKEAFHLDGKELLRNPSATKFSGNPTTLLGTHCICLKSYQPGERGVLNILYSEVLALFPTLFDLEQIEKRYTIVLEPTWSGYFDSPVLQYQSLKSKVMVQAFEPNDYQFCERLRSNLVPVKVSNNSWISEQIFHPLQGVSKDFDIVMNAAWADYKRHAAFLSAVKKVAQNGVLLRIALAGYPAGRSKEHIQALAKHFGVEHQIEFFEHLKPTEVNQLFNRSKLQVLWSLKEGVNRSIIEGLMADVPLILHQGFNYGYAYPYINSATGQFASEESLPVVILDMLKNLSRYSPRKWTTENFSCQKNNQILNEALKSCALAAGEPWTRDIVCKVNLHLTQDYYHAEERNLFDADYDYLRTVIL